jgi:transcriptional regulator with XRE-family HTH domain
MSQRRSTGNRVLAAREAKGLSLRRAARRLGVSPRALRGWEHGRSPIPYAVRLAMVDLYGIPRQEIAPDRPVRAEQDGATGAIRIGSLTFIPTGNMSDADDDSLRAFLSAIRRERGLPSGAALEVRESDALLLAELLGGTADDIVRNLQRLLGVSETEAVELGRWMLRRTAVAGALAMGLAAGVIAGSGTFSANPPAAGADQVSSTSSVAPPADPDWAVIGDAAVLWNDKVPVEERN